MNKAGEGMLMGIVLGIVGVIVGGRIFSAVGHSDVPGFNIYSIFVSVIGAVLFERAFL